MIIIVLQILNLAEVLRKLNPSTSEFKWKDIKLILKDERWRREKALLREVWN